MDDARVKAILAELLGGTDGASAKGSEGQGEQTKGQEPPKAAQDGDKQTSTSQEIEALKKELEEAKAAIVEIKANNERLIEERNQLARPDVSGLNDRDKELWSQLEKEISDPLQLRTIYQSLQSSGKFESVGAKMGDQRATGQPIEAPKPTSLEDVRAQFQKKAQAKGV